MQIGRSKRGSGAAVVRHEANPGIDVVRCAERPRIGDVDERQRHVAVRIVIVLEHPDDAAVGAPHDLAAVVHRYRRLVSRRQRRRRRMRRRRRCAGDARHIVGRAVAGRVVGASRRGSVVDGCAAAGRGQPAERVISIADRLAGSGRLGTGDYGRRQQQAGSTTSAMHSASPLKPSHERTKYRRSQLAKFQALFQLNCITQVEQDPTFMDSELAGAGPDQLYLATS